jgi:hypothetical protein
MTNDIVLLAFQFRTWLDLGVAHYLEARTVKLRPPASDTAFTDVEPFERKPASLLFRTSESQAS